jgi:CheY-like chemotaxis protein
VLLDLKLPKISGLEVLDWIRNVSDRRDLPVFMLTSSNDPKDVERARSLGVHAYLTKPVGLQGIREIARNVAEFVSSPGLAPEPLTVRT